MLIKRESYNMAEHQLGWQVSILDLIDIAEFLTGKKLPFDEVRHNIHLCDGDAKLGVLTAFGINSPEGLKAFDAVEVVGFYKSMSGDILAAPKSIQYVGGVVDIAKQLIKAYGERQVSPVSLGGKHSGGSYIAEIDDSSWLLKPASGKISPAAGMDESKINQSRREAAFAEVADSWEIKEVNPVSLLAIDGKEIAAIKMWPLTWVNMHKAKVEDKNLPNRILTPYLQRGTLHKWAVLDGVLGNVDRHGNNIMNGPDGHVGLIDHGSSFAGDGFDPANDIDSFIPYYLRVWSKPGFNTMDYYDQLKVMPTIHNEKDNELRDWVLALNESELENILFKYGIDPEPSLKRLKIIKNAVMHNMCASRAINEFWISI